MTKRHLTALFCATSMLFPAAALAQGANQNQQAGQQDGPPCEVLVNYLEQYEGYNFPVTLEEANELNAQGDEEACRSGIEEIDQAVRSNQVERTAEAGQQDQQRAQAGQASGDAEGAEIVVQQTPPRILVEQSAPEVTVQQPQPQVTVTQPTPEILVQQPAPTVTVDIPQPVITLRMPEPQVNVQMAQPQVQVEQAQPQVRVAETGQPQVEVQQQDAEVMVQRQQQQAQVQVQQQGEPEVRYEREEAQVRINQAEGGPEVRIERTEGAQPEQAQQQGQQRQQTAAVANQEQAETPQAGAQQQTTGEGIRVSNLLDANVVNEEGEEIGTVERVMINPESNETQVIVSLSGSVGEEGRQVALSVDQLTMQGEQVVISGMSDEQIEQAPEWSEQEGFREASETDAAQIRPAAPAQ